MAYFYADIKGAVALWQYSEQQIDPRSDEGLIVSGLRETALVSCQYWIKGLSAICVYWRGEACTAVANKEGQFPSGYNNKNCDYLGRRSLCSQYEVGGEENLEKYWCIAPNIFLSGLGIADGTASSYIYYPVPYSDIPGYCKGRCDEQGRGTGCDGIPGESPVICKYYRPWQMGFGAVEPHQLERTIRDDGTIEITAEALKTAYGLVGKELGTRLPYSFKVYNLRAYMQTCAYWDSDYGSAFSMDSEGIKLGVTSSELCTSTEDASTPYSTLATAADLGIDEWLLQDVWSKAATVICNGAKPECPCYTGKWDYVTDVKMVEGMRIGVNQIFELRFYAYAWDSNEEYEDAFTAKPNWQDVSTADIYTFDKWIKESLPSESVMQGTKFSLCMPAIVNQREFLPEKYVTTQVFQYSKADVNPGTTVPKENQIYSPTLIRDPDTEVMYMRFFDVIYPYTTVEPFNDAVYCSGAVNKETYRCIKRSISLEGDSISVIGATLRSRAIYAFNLNYFDESLSEFSKYSNTYAMPDESNSSFTDDFAGLSIREIFFVKLEELIKEYTKIAPAHVFSTISDSVTGYFQLGPIPIKYQEENTIIVCVHHASEQFWDFRVKKVLSKFYGGALVQTNFTYEGSKLAYEFMPDFFSGPASLAGTGYSFIDAAGGVSDSPTAANPSCTLEDIKHVGSQRYTDELMNQKSVYNYCIKKITETNVQVDNWTRVGNAGVVWVEIEDLNLNNIFEWEVISAQMVLIGEDNPEGGETVTGSPSVCREGDSVVEMEVKEIEAWTAGQSSIPSSACVLETKDGKPRGFFNSDWDLKITYWYKKISDNITEAENEEVVWPSTVSDGVFTDENMSFTPSQLSLSAGEGNFTVGAVRSQTVSLMGYFNNEEGRLMSCVASKMLVQVVDLKCRNVEIFYSYEAPIQHCKLIPDSWFADYIGTDSCVPSDYTHSYTPPCGEHKTRQSDGKGYIWYPFNQCETSDFYREFSHAAFCTEFFPKVPRDDMRFCGPPVYKSWAYSSGSVADCIMKWHYRYSVQYGDLWWNGGANIIARVNVLYYLSKQPVAWALPPFGNKGREMVEKWFSQECWHYTTYKDTLKPHTKVRWVPIVPDKEHFSKLSFNAFEEPSGSDLFSHMSQLNFMTSQLIEESIEMNEDTETSEDTETDDSEYELYRFDEVFGERGIFAATYPPPIVAGDGVQRIIHYHFKEEDVVWAWVDYWPDIEYVDARELLFVDYKKPDYVYDYVKMEHRYICAQKEYIIIYTAPESTGGELTKFPSIKLGGGQARYFDIRYGSHDSTTVTWKDDNEGSVDGSGGIMDVGEVESGNIYEKTSSKIWSHDENILFDEEAVDNFAAAEEAGRKLETSFDEYTYYNRGIIANITRNQVKHLPYGELPMGNVEFDEEGSINIPENPAVKVWYGVGPTLSHTADDAEGESNGAGDESVSYGRCISKIVIKGKWGIHAVNKNVVPEGESNEFEGCLPGITITGNTVGGASNVLYRKGSMAHDRKIHNKPNIGLKRFTFTISLQPTPSRMMLDTESEIQIKLDCAGLQYIFLDEISMTQASYKDSTETIKVYERKYVVSRGSDFGDVNINGPSKILHHELDLDNSGVYYPIHPDFSYITDDPVNAKDKMRAIYAGKQYREDEAITPTPDPGDISGIEKNEQKKLYNEAYNVDTDGDTTTFTLVCPPQMKQFFARHNISNSIAGQFVSICKKLDWKDHYLESQYVPGEIWQPQGHKFQWSGKIMNMNCYDPTPTSNYLSGMEIDPDAIMRFNIHSVYYLHLDKPKGGTDEEKLVVPVLTSLYYSRKKYQLEVVEKYFEEPVSNVQGGLVGIASTFTRGDDVLYTPEG